MQRQSLFNSRDSFKFGKVPDGQIYLEISGLPPNSLPSRNNFRVWLVRSTIPSIMLTLCVDAERRNRNFQRMHVRTVPDNISGALVDEDDDLCPIECVREFKTDAEFSKILEKARETDSLVVVDFYRTSCGSCKYIAQGFSKLCKGSGSEDAPIIFLKHNVMDEYDEQSEVAERLRIKAVPLFHFYKNGVLLEAFPTRDKERILAAILKYSSTPQGI
ncbi:hypothetical protein AQUCO_01500063v1 [Aquilegia coerulea]|uniref:Thioredoxin domain-containing protein n=1 Tax=Aquilegia coerulea TaxID=218851 RepID=A0A2G5DS03_AQUCA|nr:hypothetical protein AQUCO_01500063v1 [Aquilegia coerulea]